MKLHLCQATVDEADRIAEIHLAAFDSNPLLHVQFPTQSSLRALRDVLAHDMRHSIEAGEGCGKVVLVVKDESLKDMIISFAKWEFPVPNTELQQHPHIVWPEACRIEYLDRYQELADSMKDRVIGSQPCYRMTFVGTDPEHFGRGAATLLTRWGTERADRAGLPAYLEATMEAVSMYRTLGFVDCDELLLPLPILDENGKPLSYKEVGMMYGKSSSLSPTF